MWPLFDRFTSLMRSQSTVDLGKERMSVFSQRAEADLISKATQISLLLEFVT